MLPSELPLSLARTVAPSPPPMAQENSRALDVHQGRTPHVMVPSPATDPLSAHAIRADPLTHLAAAHDQTGNAAVAGVALQAVPGTVPLPSPGRRS